MAEQDGNSRAIEAELNKPAVRRLIDRLRKPKPRLSVEGYLRKTGVLKAEPLIGGAKRRKSLPGQLGLFD